MDYLSLSLMWGSLLPAVALLSFLFERQKATSNGTLNRSTASSVNALIVLTVISLIFTWWGGQLSHIDCGSNCDPSVPTYSQISQATLLLAVIWVTASVWAFGELRRLKSRIPQQQPKAS